LIGRASRLLVIAALVPAAMMGLTVLDRAAQARLRTGLEGMRPADH
jgi:hypothetical protein